MQSLRTMSFWLIGLSLFLSGCSGQNAEEDPLKFASRTSQAKNQDTYDQQVAEMQAGTLATDSFVLDRAWLEGSNLMVKVSYGGGCQQHLFRLVWPEAIIAIYPPVFEVILSHDGQGDMCRAIVTETLVFDLASPELGFNSQVIADMHVILVNGSNPNEKTEMLRL